MPRFHYRYSQSAGIDRTEREFLPAALEIMARPPSPLGPLLLWVIVLLFVAGILWSIRAEVDIVTTAEGRLIPSGRVKKIQPMEQGIVRRILVKNGDRVKKGQILVEIDQTITLANLERTRQQLADSRLVLRRLQTLSDCLGMDGMASACADPAYMDAPADRNNPGVQLNNQLIARRLREYHARTAAMTRGLDRLVAEKHALNAAIAKLQSVLPLISRRAEAVKTLFTARMASEFQYLELEQSRIETVQDLEIQKSNRRKLDAAIAESRQQLSAFREQVSAGILDEMVSEQQRINLLSEELKKTRELNAIRILRSPIQGLVQQLAIHTVNGVVTPAQQLMLIVPDTRELLVEAFIDNNDIGFVNEQDHAEVKIHTFPFTRYGLADARVVHISNDAINQENRGAVFQTLLSLRHDYLRIGDRYIRLTPGMTVTAEIKTGKRRLIEFFLAPLLRYRHDSVRER